MHLGNTYSEVVCNASSTYNTCIARCHLMIIIYCYAYVNYLKHYWRKCVENEMHNKDIRINKQ